LSVRVGGHRSNVSDPPFPLDRVATYGSCLFCLLRRDDVHAANRVGSLSHAPSRGYGATPFSDGCADRGALFRAGSIHSGKEKSQGSHPRTKFAPGTARERVGLETRRDRWSVPDPVFHVWLFHRLAEPRGRSEEHTSELQSRV